MLTTVSSTLVLSLILAGTSQYFALLSTTGAILLVVLAVVSVIVFSPLVTDKKLTMLDRWPFCTTEMRAIVLIFICIG